MMGLTTIAQGTAEIAEPNMVLIILSHALTPLMLPNLAFAIAAFVTGFTCKSKKWIPIACGVTFLALAALQLYLRTAKCYSIVGTYGMGHPEAFAQATWTFISVVFITPILAPLAIVGLSIAAFQRAWLRAMICVVLWAMLVTTNALIWRQYDEKLSLSLADSRGYHAEKLWKIQCDAYAATFKAGGVGAKPTRDEYNALGIPRKVNDDIFRDSFFEEFPPPSILKQFLTDTLFQNQNNYSEKIRSEVFDKHHAACEAEGIRLANERLERKD